MNPNSKDKPVLVIGAGGHAKVLVGALLRLGRPIRGLLDAERSRHGTMLLGQPVLGGDEQLEGVDPGSLLLVNGLGSVGLPIARQRLFERLTAKGFRFASVIDPAAFVSPDVAMAAGVQVMAGAVVQPGCSLGENCIVNSRASLDHDCSIGAHAHVAPGAVLSGEVRVGEGSHLGTGAVVIQGRSIGAGSLVAAGAVVVRDVAAGEKLAGVPARPLK
ncbi:acetyltransferase [Ferrovibrio sp.]|uniref:acetyltransferase n=1 Tax=Ferrovibrio sp. TaxID=1917215 RepID=UPI0025C60999|nr:acetyltransferase [Ferrovibrio sp.]MBX3456281.1 acetyltransferase [Ferrovibrio sp.]